MVKFPFINLTGQVFSRLTVLRRAKNDDHYGAQFLCRCECGTEKIIKGRYLTSGDTRSCGCLYREATAQIQFKHGLTRSPEYVVWAGMKQRCSNPNHKAYPDYGARGIAVCEEWFNSFETFFSDMGKRPTAEHSIEREDNDGPYAAWNCKWATRLEQRHNRRDSR